MTRTVHLLGPPGRSAGTPRRGLIAAALWLGACTPPRDAHNPYGTCEDRWREGSGFGAEAQAKFDQLVSGSPPELRPDLSPDLEREVRAFVEGSMPLFERCYEFEMGERGVLLGEVLVHFAIGLGGYVAKVVVLSNTTGAGGLGYCIQHAVCDWRFPARYHKESVVYPVAFLPAPQG